MPDSTTLQVPEQTERHEPVPTPEPDAQSVTAQFEEPIETQVEEEPMIPPQEMPEPDVTTLIGVLIAVLVALLLVYAIRRQKRKRREEIDLADQLDQPETEAPYPPEEALPPSRDAAPVPPPAEGPPTSPEAALEARETEKEQRRRAFLEKQRLAREEKEREEADQRAAELAAEEEAKRIAKEEEERRATEEAARREAMLAPSGPLTDRLAQTRSGFVGKLNALLGKRMDEDTLEEIEEVLFTADIGVKTAGNLLETVRDSMRKSDLADPERIREALKRQVASVLSKDGFVPGKEAIDPESKKERPFVIMVVGVNGVGKTTTIGKLAGRYAAQGKKVVLAAGDTFRAAAVEQLEFWGDRVGSRIVKGEQGADPGSVIFDAVRAGHEDGADVVIVDTAGRLHTKVPLMEELKKVHRVLGKARAGAPDEVLLVVDATTGQNALQQAKMFQEVVPISGIALTKLDGTAKGGVVIAICEELGLPVRYIGVGEKVGDLQPFDPEGFVEALFTQ